MKTLHELGDELLAIAATLDDYPGGEVPPEVDARLTEILSTELPTKLDHCLAFVADRRMWAARAQAEAEQWLARARRERKQEEWMLGRIQAVLEATGQDRVVTARGKTVSLQVNGGPPPLEIDAETDPEIVARLHPELTRVGYSLNSNAIRAALVRGDRVAFAKLLPRGRHLRVRV